MVRYNGLVWSNIAVTFFYHPIYMIIEFMRENNIFQIIGDVRGRGMFFGIDLVKNRETREPHPVAAEHILSILKEVFLFLFIL